MRGVVFFLFLFKPGTASVAYSSATLGPVSFLHVSSHLEIPSSNTCEKHLLAMKWKQEVKWYHAAGSVEPFR